MHVSFSLNPGFEYHYLLLEPVMALLVEEEETKNL